MTPEVGRIYRGKPDPDNARASVVYRVCTSIEDGMCQLVTMMDVQDDIVPRKSNCRKVPYDYLDQYWDETPFVLEGGIMANTAKQKGTRNESRVVKFLRDAGIDASRRPLKGANDIGDILVGDDIILEVKCGDQCKHVTRGRLEKWMRQVYAEIENAEAMLGFLVILKPGHAIENAEVWSGADFTDADETSTEDLVAHRYAFRFLDDFTVYIKRILNPAQICPNE